MSRLTGDPRTDRGLPEVFCWTKFGAEAGEDARAIFARKEVERELNGGLFLWGIGSSVGPSLIALLRLTDRPRVLFSAMRAAPAARDVAPSALLLWTEAVGIDGVPFVLPRYSVVTSRAPGRPRREPAHFALVCKSATPLSINAGARAILLDEVRNLRSGASLGASQVTSIVRTVGAAHPTGPSYPVAAEAELTYPYFVRLTRGLPIPPEMRLSHSGQEGDVGALRKLLDLRASAPRPQQQLLPA